MKRLAAVLVLGLTIAACGGDDGGSGRAATTSPPSSSPATSSGAAASGGYGAAPTTAAPTAAGSGVTLQLTDAKGTKVLASGDGRAVYLYTKDGDQKSTCSGGCATAWPAVTAAGEPSVGAGLDAEDIGTITRDDGTKQVTFYGHPLYHYSGDEKAGDTNGQGSGSVWYLVDDEGNAVK
jgi:predicted lipoprotein with Yx(FWY)xxD motif